MSSETTHFVERISALANLVIGMGSAIQALASLGEREAAAELAEQMKHVAKRPSWIEKSNDPNWTPYDPDKPARRIRVPRVAKQG